MENEQKTVSKGDIQRRTDNENLEAQLQAEREQKTTDIKKDDQESIVVANPVTKKILDGYGINSVTQDELNDGDQESKDEPAIVENKQVANENNDETIDITEADLKALEESGIPESDLEGKTAKEVKDMATNLQKKQVDTQEPEKIIISDAYAEALAKRYGFAKSLKGKTLDEVMEIIQQQNSYITKIEQQMKAQSDVDVKQADNKSHNSKTNDELTEQEVVDLMALDPKEATLKINEMVQKKLDSELDQKINEKLKGVLPDIEKLRSASVDKEKEAFYAELGSKLPEGVDSQAVFQDWKKNQTYSKEELMKLVDTPSVMITLIAQDYNLRQVKNENTEIKKTKDQEIKKHTYENVRKFLKNGAKMGPDAKFNFTRKNSKAIDLETGETGSPAEQMIGNIIAKQLRD